MSAETTAAVTNPDTAPKGGFWIRVLAAIIDGILLAIIGGILRQSFGTGAGGGLSTLVGLVYFVYFWSNGGQTIGFRALKLQVIKTDGSALTIADGVIRYIGEIISTVVLFVGLMWVGWDRQKQGWHDKMAHTYVIRL